MFHIKCVCHILNLCKDSYEHVKNILTRVRDIIIFIRSSGPRQQHFKAPCREQKLPYRKFQLDIDTRWNSTLDMLHSVFPYKQQLIELTLTHGEQQLDSNVFDEGIVISSPLQTFQQAIELLSGQYYPITL